MLELEALSGLRVAASREALDAAAWDVGAVVLRFAPDDALVIGATEVQLSDEDAILAAESGFVGAWLSPDELEERVLPHLEWPLPDARPALAQGFVAGVPTKLWLGHERSLLVCAAAYAHELADRL